MSTMRLTSLWFVGKMLIAVLICFTACKRTSESHEAPNPDQVIRILAIGNSFSEDALESYLLNMTQHEDLTIIIGNLYYGGASLGMHWDFASNGQAVYEYRKAEGGQWDNMTNCTLDDAILDEPWDVVSFQQVSSESGIAESYRPSLDSLFEYVNTRISNSAVKYIFHQTWAYEQHAAHPGFVNYQHRQDTMYRRIISAASQVTSHFPFDRVVPSGTAIQNVRTSIIGDHVCRDGYHLNDIGRYAVSCAWFQSLYGVPAPDGFKPETLTDYEATICREAAKRALANPTVISEMTDFQTGGMNGKIDHPVLINLGTSESIASWNGISDFMEGATLGNLKDSLGNYTDIALEIQKRFTGSNNYGETSTFTAYNIPSSVSQYAFFGNSKASHDGIITDEAVMVIKGLDKNEHYQFCFFSSRREVANENRAVQITLNDDPNQVAVLDASNNTSTVVCVTNVEPDESGEVKIRVTAGNDNTNAFGYYYLNAMRITRQ